MDYPYFSDIDIDLNYFDNLYNGLHDNQQYFNSDLFNNKFHNDVPNLSNNLSIMHVNIRSISANGDELVAYLETLILKFDIICLTETWLNDDNFIDNIFTGYIGYHSMRQNRRGGGVSIYVNNEFVSKELHEFSCNLDHIEIVFADVIQNNKHFIIGSCYRPPSQSNYSNFISSFFQKVSFLNSQSDDLIICGDFNLDLLKIQTINNVSDFYDNVNTLSLVPTITKPTRVSTNCHSLIDNILVSKPFNYSSGLLSFDVSDHFPIFIIYNNFFNQSHSAETVEYRLINNITLEKLYSNLENTSFQDVLDCDDCDLSISKLNNIIITQYNLCCPIKTKIIKKKDRDKPWISNSLKNLIKKRQRYFYLLKQGKLTSVLFKSFKNFVTNQIRLKKKMYYKNLLINVKSDIKKTWNIINSVLKPDQTRKKLNIKSLLHNNILYESNEGISNTFNSYFASIGSQIASSFHSNNNNSISNIHSISNSLFFRNISENEINRLIQNMKNKSSPISTYPVKVLKYISKIISPILASIVNKSLGNGIFPEQFKVARVIPLYKGGDKSTTGNYRPISVLPILSKVFERVVFNQLYNFLEKYSLLNCSQYGFRAKMSTSLAVMDQLKYVYENLDSGATVISLFLDFSKAFDCIDHNILLGKLYRYGVRGITLDWFKSYLSNRNQYVSVNNTNSQIKPITHGVPQGSILGPLLFLLFINDFPNCNPFFKYTLFADDSTLSCKFTNSDEVLITQTLNSELKLIDEWLTTNKLKVNYSKSKFIVFSYRKSISISPLQFGSNTISQTDSIKFLGITLDNKLNFREHIGSICCKISKSVGLLYRLNKFFPSDTLKTLYHTLVVPHISYGIEAWYGAPQCARSRVFVLQKKAIRAIHSLPYNFHTHEFFKSTQLLKLDDIYNLKIAIHMYNKFSNRNFSTHADIHIHNTRNRDNIVLPRYHMSKTQLYWLYRGTQLWNFIPDRIRDSECSNKFKNLYRNHLFSAYQ